MVHKEYVNGYYDGEVNERRKPHGHGIKHYKTGVVFEGEYVDGKANGFGITTFPDGRRLEADRVDDGVTGHAKWYMGDKLIAEGDYDKGKLTGNWVFHRHEHMEGTYVDGKKNGKWVFWCDDYRREVEYAYGVMNGPFDIRYKDGIHSTGEYLRGKKSGRWADEFPDGTRIDKGYKKNKEEGDWIISYPNGYKTKLIYRRGWPKKEAQVISPDGKEAFFKTGEITPTFMKRPIGDDGVRGCRTQRIMYQDGYYEGEVNENGVPHGYGTRFFKMGTIFDGHYVDGEEDGFGIVYFTNGLRIEAYRSVGKKHGEAKWYFGDWVYEEGEYLHGIKNGRWINRMNGYLEGDFFKSEKNGRFIIENEDLCSETDYYDGYMSGPSKIVYNSGLRSVGRYLGGLQTGRWVNYFIDGSYEEGDYFKGMKHGEWTIYRSNGDIAKQKYSGGFPKGKEKIIYTEGTDIPAGLTVDNIGYDGRLDGNEKPAVRSYSDEAEVDSIEEPPKKKGFLSGLFGKK